MTRLIFSVIASCAICVAVSQVWFYGGDTNAISGIACERDTIVSDARTYDDFDLTSVTRIAAVWGNFALINFVPKHGYYEIRRNVTPGDGGELLAAGLVPVEVFFTGREATAGLLEFHVRAKLSEGLELPPGKYWMCLAPVGTGVGRSLVSLTDGDNRGPGSDPNPPPTGQPIDNGNSFFDSDFFGQEFARVEDVVGGPYDMSYGVGALTSETRALSLADSFLVTRGSLVSGAIQELWGSDEKKLVVQQRYPFNASSPNVQVEIETFAPVFSGTRHSARIETSCSASPTQNVLQRVEGFNFMTQDWATLDERAPSRSDVSFLVLPVPPREFCEPLTNRIRLRLSWFDRGALNLGWRASIDYMLWDVTP